MRLFRLKKDGKDQHPSTPLDLPTPCAPLPQDPASLSRSNATRRHRRKSVAPFRPDITDRESSLYPPPLAIESSYLAETRRQARSSSRSDRWGIVTPPPRTSSRPLSCYEEKSLPAGPHRLYSLPAKAVSTLTVSFDVPHRQFGSLALFETETHQQVWKEAFHSARHARHPDPPAVGGNPRQAWNHTTWDLRMTTSDNLVGKGGRGMSEVWANAVDDSEMIAPPKPPRSALRSAPQVLYDASAPFTLAVDRPLPQDTPSLSSAASSEAGSPRITSTALPMLAAPSMGIRRASRGAGSKERDPLKIRDGADPKMSTSGIYTPTTFPGAQGPRPSHFPSHVYTPGGFNLYTSSSESGPSRSASMTSTKSSGSSPTSPKMHPVISGVAGRTLSSFRRMSYQIASLDPRTPSTPATPKDRDSYFPPMSSDSIRSVSTDNGPTTPSSAIRAGFGWRGNDLGAYFSPTNSSAGLGLGMQEKEGATYVIGPETLARMDGSVGDLCGSPKSPALKGKRKPVPKIADENGGEDVEVHAI